MVPCGDCCAWESAWYSPGQLWLCMWSSHHTAREWMEGQEPKYTKSDLGHSKVQLGKRTERVVSAKESPSGGILQ